MKWHPGPHESRPLRAPDVPPLPERRADAAGLPPAEGSSNAGVAAQRPPGRPRSHEADTAIARATMELLAEVGYDALSIEQVAARAGISKSTLYRRFPSKGDLVVATIGGIVRKVPVREMDGMSTREALLQMLRVTAEVVTIPGALGLLSVLTSGRPSDRDVAQAVRDQVMGPPLREVGGRLAMAIARREIRADAPIDVAITTLWGALIARVLTGEPLDDAWLERLLTVVWDGIAPA